MYCNFYAFLVTKFDESSWYYEAFLSTRNSWRGKGKASLLKWKHSAKYSTLSESTLPCTVYCRSPNRHYQLVCGEHYWTYAIFIVFSLVENKMLLQLTLQDRQETSVIVKHAFDCLNFKCSMYFARRLNKTRRDISVLYLPSCKVYVPSHIDIILLKATHLIFVSFLPVC